jgi:membrane-bound lytic murein transglycosylase F
MPTRAQSSGANPARVYPMLTLIALIAVLVLWQSGCAVPTAQIGIADLNRPPVTRDLDEIQASRSLRVLMANSSSSYYVLRGEEYGFEFEMASKVASELGLHLQVVLPDAVLSPVEMLQSGLVDVIAMPVLHEDRIGTSAALTVPYHSVQQRLVIHRDQAARVEGLRDIHGLQIAARRFSSGERELARLRRLGIDLVAVLYGPEVPQEQILDLVADGTYPAAIALDVEVDAAQRFREELHASVPLGPRKDVHWAVRSNSPNLLAALDEVLAGHVRRKGDGRLIRSEFYNVVRARYFENTPRAERHLADEFMLTRTGKISPYDRLFRKAGREHGFDWHLLAALSFQESRFDPNAESWAGAYGLMQLKPRTAGVSAEELDDPKLNVQLGASHLRMLYDLYHDVPEADRMRFALAAYNCGQGHLDDARKLSTMLGKNPDAWESSVRESLLLLRQPNFHRMVRYGYVRGNETVAYVREIEQRFERLKQMVANARPVSGAGGGTETVLEDTSAMTLTAPSVD